MPNLAQYNVLVTDLLSTKDREQILADLVNIHHPQSPLKAGYSIKMLDHFGRCAVVMHMGREVMVLFKRMTTVLGVTNLEVAPRAHLKNEYDAWIAYKLMDLYPGVPLGEKISKLEHEIEQKDAIIASLTESNHQSSMYVQELLSRLHKKAAKTAIPAAEVKPLASPEINAYLLKIKPVKMQDVVRAAYLWGQGFDTALVHSNPPHPVLTVKNKKKAQNYLGKLDKMLKKAKQEKDTELYSPRPPKEKKTKATKKTTTKKIIKKVVKKKGKLK